MKLASKLTVILIAYISIVLISSCCDNSDATLNGKMNIVILSDYDVVPEAINNDVIRTGFVLTYFPETDLVFTDFKPIGEVYGQDGCTSSVLNSLDQSTVAISFDKDVRIGNNTFTAGTNLLALNQFSSVEISDSCANRTNCEIRVAIPTSIVQTMTVEDGPLTINFTAQTDDGVSFNDFFETEIDLL